MSNRDERYLEYVAQADDEGFTRLYREVAPQARQIAYHILHDANAADDVVQEAFYAVLIAMRAGRGPCESVTGYISTVARRLAYRQRRENQLVVAAGDPVDGSEPSTESAFTSLAPRGVDASAGAAAAWASLPPRWRYVLWLIEVDKYSPAELAPVMGMTPSAVSSLGTRARRALRTAYLEGLRRKRPAERGARQLRSAPVRRASGSGAPSPVRRTSPLREKNLPLPT